MHTKNPLNDFIVDKYRERQNKISMETYLEGDEPMRTVTVRLHFDQVETIDRIAKYLDVSRQQLMQSIIEGGISSTLTSLAYASLISKKEVSNAPPDELEEMVEAERVQFVKELIK